MRIEAVVWEKEEEEKGIITARQDNRLTKMGKLARVSIEGYFVTKLKLELWVKVREGWADSEVLLRSIEYGDE